MLWKFDNNRPIYSQIVEIIKRSVASGVLKPGSRLPSVRNLAEEAGVNPNTMQRALAELERAEIVRAFRTSGRFITDEENMIFKMKNELAQEHIREFLQSMRQIGYTKEETADLIKNHKEDDIK